jgi:hypothetical protein
MSVATIGSIGIEDDLAPASAISGRMPGGIALSAMMHLGLATLILIGLPNLFRPPMPVDTPIAVELVNIGPETRATHPNPHRPVAKAKPIPPPPTPPAPVPEPKPVPTPPPASAEPPPSAAAPPPTLAPPKPDQAVLVPPPPPPKPVEAPAPTPTPPPPEAKPKPAEKQPTPSFDQMVRHLDRQQKTPPSSFDSLLRNLTRNDAPRSEDTPPQRTRMASASAAPSSQPQAPLGSQLSASEIDLVREQIEQCWNVPAGARDAKDLVIEVKAVVNPDGTVQEATIIDQGRYGGDPYYRAAAESARRAVLNPRCSPLKLPPDKYDSWRDLDLFFNPKDVL